MKTNQPPAGTPATTATHNGATHRQWSLPVSAQTADALRALADSRGESVSATTKRLILAADGKIQSAVAPAGTSQQFPTLPIPRGWKFDPTAPGGMSRKTANDRRLSQWDDWLRIVEEASEAEGLDERRENIAHGIAVTFEPGRVPRARRQAARRLAAKLATMSDQQLDQWQASWVK